MLLLAEFTGWHLEEILDLTVEEFTAWCLALDDIHKQRKDANEAGTEGR